MSKENIYKLKLHQEIDLSTNISIKRVPGGWIYYVVSPVGITATFVALNDEFNEPTLPEPAGVATRVVPDDDSVDTN